MYFLLTVSIICRTSTWQVRLAVLLLVEYTCCWTWQVLSMLSDSGSAIVCVFSLASTRLLWNTWSCIWYGSPIHVFPTKLSRYGCQILFFEKFSSCFVLVVPVNHLAVLQDFFLSIAFRFIIILISSRQRNQTHSSWNQCGRTQFFSRFHSSRRSPRASSSYYSLSSQPLRCLSQLVST